MFTITDDQSIADPDFDSLMAERPERSPLTSESVLNSGAWRARAAARAAEAEPVTAEALEWHPETTLRQRIIKAISVPAFAGAAVFVVAVIIAIVMTMLQSGAAIDTPSASALGEGERSTASTDSSSAKPMAGAEGTDPTKAPSSTPTPTSKIFVHVVGEVLKPGVVELASGTRVAEAIAAAGGATSAAALEAVNLARIVADGEQLLIPNTEQAAATLPEPAAPGGAAPSGVSETATGALVNINTADATLLETLPRIGPALAQRILDWRQANGAFASIDQLMEVSGVGAKTFEGLREKVTV